MTRTSALDLFVHHITKDNRTEVWLSTGAHPNGILIAVGNDHQDATINALSTLSAAGVNLALSLKGPRT